MIGFEVEAQGFYSPHNVVTPLKPKILTSMY